MEVKNIRSLIFTMSENEPQNIDTKANWRKKILAYVDLEDEPCRGFESKDKKIVIVKTSTHYICVPKGEQIGVISAFIDKNGLIESYTYSGQGEEAGTVFSSNDPEDIRKKTPILDRLLSRYEAEIRDFFTTPKTITVSEQKTSATQSAVEEKVLATIDQLEDRALITLAYKYLQKPLKSEGFEPQSIISNPSELIFQFIGKRKHEITPVSIKFGKNKLLLQFDKAAGYTELRKIQKAINGSGKLKFEQQVQSDRHLDYYIIGLVDAEITEDDEPMAWAIDT